jgi:hypothetical protein
LLTERWTMDNNQPPSAVPTPIRNYHWIYAIVFVLSLAIFAVGIYLAANRDNWMILSAGCISLVVALAAWPVASAVAQSRRDSADQMRLLIDPVHERLEQFSVMLNLISEQQLITERTKTVAFREKERDSLRMAIQEDILKGDYEAALALANEMEEGFGYKQEADRVRRDIENRRNEVRRKAVTDAATLIDRHCRAEQWPSALREAEKLRNQFPIDDQVQRLPAEIENRWQNQKKQLMDSWKDAVTRHDVDGGIEILKRLDQYLTPDEANAMQEGARSVFKEKLNNLRTQFTVSVQDHKWAEAVRVGDEIIRDFPNTQMAKEVRDVIENLRQRAGMNGASAESAALAKV